MPGESWTEQADASMDAGENRFCSVERSGAPRSYSVPVRRSVSGALFGGAPAELIARTRTYDGGWFWECEVVGSRLGWESESVVVQGSFPFLSARSSAEEVEADRGPELVGWDGGGNKAVEEVEAALSRSGDELVDELGAVLDSLGVVLDRGLVDSDASRDVSFELRCWGVVEEEVAAELVIFPGWDDLAATLVLLKYRLV